ncbi:DUF4179 domain-containing protein [Paenibacillus sp. NPDC058071]|uniref:DUF4179 domain-containing protein n=1 Tax=Paenibacillus sp. NPDC058071 TaxID=3346326 RepID=UPI0036DA580D
MHSEMERKLMDNLSKECDIPDSVLRKTEAAFVQIRKLKSESVKKRGVSLRKRRVWVAAAALFGVLTVSILSNDSAIAAIKSFFYKDTGIQKAVDNGFLQTVNHAVEDSGVTVQVDRIVADKTKLVISFQLDFGDSSRVRTVDRVFLDLDIHDGNGRAIVEDGNRNSLASSMDWESDVTRRDSGKVIYDLIVQSPQGKFDDMQALSLDIKSISLYWKHFEKPYRVITGDWKSRIELDKKFTNHESVKYTAEENQLVKVLSAEMLPTGMAIEFIVAVPVDESILRKVTLLDDQGNTYLPSNTATMDYTEDGKDVVSMTFDATAFDQIDGLKMIVKEVGDEDVAVNLFKEGASR